MMQLTEFRIGNIVAATFFDKTHTVQADVTCKIAGIDITKPHPVRLKIEKFRMDSWHNLKNIEGIQLTADWMLAFGFEANMGGYYMENGPSNTLCWWAMNIDFDDPASYRKAIPFELGVGVSGKLLHVGKLPHIKYVHQLQNIYFALEGKELELIS
jgi:hypothetical protein